MQALLHPGAEGCEITSTIDLAPDEDLAGNSFARVLAAAITRSRLPLERIQSRLAASGTPVSVATLSYWQTGRSVPRRRSSLRAVTNLEAIVGVEPGSLTGLLPAPGVGSDEVALSRCATPSTHAAKVLKAFGLPYSQPVSMLKYVVEQRVAGEGVVTTRTEVRMRVLEGAVDRLPSVLPLPRNQNHPVWQATQGYAMGREYRDHRHGLLVCELLLPRAYRAGEDLHLVTGLDWGLPATPRDDFEWTLPARCPDFRLRVRFDGKAPRQAAHYTRCSPGASSPAIFGERLDVRQRTISYTSSDAPPAVHGIRWTW